MLVSAFIFFILFVKPKRSILIQRVPAGSSVVVLFSKVASLWTVLDYNLQRFDNVDFETWFTEISKFIPSTVHLNYQHRVSFLVLLERRSEMRRRQAIWQSGALPSPRLMSIPHINKETAGCRRSLRVQNDSRNNSILSIRYEREWKWKSALEL